VSSTRTSMSTIGFFQDWDLDAVGNWTREDDNARVETRLHSDFNDINQRTVGGQNSTPTYDLNGNTIDTGYTSLGGQSFPGGGLRMVYDALNRIQAVYQNSNTPAVTTDDVLVATYIYDCQNRRHRKVVTNSGSLNGTTDFYYDGWRVLEEHDGTDAITQQYTYGNYLDEVWTLDNRRGGGTIAFLNDHTGNYRHFYLSNTLYHVYGIMNEGGGPNPPGVLQEAYQYDSYGKQTVITNSGGTVLFNGTDTRTVGGASTINGSPYMFSGQRFDAESGLMYFKNRYFSQNLGRWLQRDPIGYHDSPNLYEYVTSRPTQFTDPAGLCGCPPLKGEDGPNGCAVLVSDPRGFDIPAWTYPKEMAHTPFEQFCMKVAGVYTLFVRNKNKGVWVHQCIYKIAQNPYQISLGGIYHGQNIELAKLPEKGQPDVPTGHRTEYEYEEKTGKLKITTCTYDRTTGKLTKTTKVIDAWTTEDLPLP
jgi:RHS repeat-associated protein